jgi:hypothetical protein
MPMAAIAGAVTCLLVGGCGGGARSDPAERPWTVAHPPSEPVRFVPGGLRTLASRRLPGIGRVSIIAKRYRFQGRLYFDIDYEVQRANGEADSSGARVEGRSPLSWSFGGSCGQGSSTAAIVVVGLLRDPEDEVLAYSRESAHRLWRASVPGYLHAGGVAVYTVLGQPPERIVVRTPAGRTVMDEALGRQRPVSCSGAGSLMFFEPKRKS